MEDKVELRCRAVGLAIQATPTRDPRAWQSGDVTFEDSSDDHISRVIEAAKRIEEFLLVDPDLRR